MKHVFAKFLGSVIASILIILHFQSAASAKIYIKIDEFSREKYPIAIAKFSNASSSKDNTSVGGQIDFLIEKDLAFTDLFRFISKKSFLEDPEKTGFSDKAINFADWAVLDAQALVKGRYSIGKDNTLECEVHLYDILLQKEIMSKKYSGPLDNLNQTVHRISNDILEALTGEPGIFDTKITFVGNQTGNKEIYIMDLDGTNVLRITQNRSINLSPDWRNDLKQIAFTSFKGGKGSELFIADLAVKTISGFSKIDGRVIGPTFNPAGNLLAFTLEAKYDRGIYLFNPSNSDLKKVTKGYSIDISPSFSPDGKEIIFSSNRSGSVQVYKMQVGSSDENAKRLTFDGKRNLDPEWSPKGDKIAFTGMDTDGYFDLFVMNSDGSNLKRLTYDTKNNEHPTWSPDGQFIVFCSNRGGTYQLYVTKPDPMSEQRQITFANFDHTMPSWSPRPR